MEITVKHAIPAQRQASLPTVMTWNQVTVDGRRCQYGEAGAGPVLVFLHGWGLGCRSYKAALSELVALGYRVIAPGLPGLSGTDELPHRSRTMRGYAKWVWSFLDQLGVDGPVTLVGHSFGGGVAITTAHAKPTRITRLVLVNSIGGSAWTSHGGALRGLSERPLWDWGLHFAGDVMPLPQLRRVVPVVLGDAIPNLMHNPGGVMRVANLAMRANLLPELGDLRDLNVPVVVVWGKQDKVLPRLSQEAITAASGANEVAVVGGHSWLLSDPSSFGEIMTNVIGVGEGQPTRAA